jgi:hypothetical protein
MKSIKNLKIVLAIIIIVAVTVLLVIGIHQLSSGNMLGYDFFYYWNTARLFSQEGQYPYSDEAAVQNQIGLYGRPAEGNEELSYYKNPIYSILFLIPLSGLTYDWAISVWIVFNILAVILCLRISFPQISIFLIIAFLFTYQVGFCLIEGNFSLLAGLSLIYVINKLLISKTPPNKHVQFFCGFFLLTATVKPQFSWMYVGFILLYCISKKYFSVLVSFFVWFVLLGGYMFIRYPTWPVDFVKLILDYSQINVPVRYQIFAWIVPWNLNRVIGDSLLTLTLLLTIYVVWIYFLGRQFFSNLAMINLLALATFIAHPSGLSYEQLVLLIPVIFWIAVEGGTKFRFIWLGIVMLFLTYLPFFLERKYPGFGVIVTLPFCIYLVWLLYVNLRPWINSSIGSKPNMSNN